MTAYWLEHHCTAPSWLPPMQPHGGLSNISPSNVAHTVAPAEDGRDMPKQHGVVAHQEFDPFSSFDKCQATALKMLESLDRISDMLSSMLSRPTVIDEAEFPIYPIPEEEIADHDLTAMTMQWQFERGTNQEGSDSMNSALDSRSHFDRSELPILSVAEEEVIEHPGTIADQCMHGVQADYVADVVGEGNLAWEHGSMHFMSAKAPFAERVDDDAIEERIQGLLAQPATCFPYASAMPWKDGPMPYMPAFLFHVLPRMSEPSMALIEFERFRSYVGVISMFDSWAPRVQSSFLLLLACKFNPVSFFASEASLTSW